MLHTDWLLVTVSILRNILGEVETDTPV